MFSGTMWMIWPGNPALSAVVLFLIALPFLYAARRPMQGLFRSLARHQQSAAPWCPLAVVQRRAAASAQSSGAARARPRGGDEVG
jgi:hypothetical protein